MNTMSVPTWMYEAAYAQNLGNTASAGRDAAVEAGQAGFQEFASFVVRNIDNWIAGLIIIAISYVVAKMAAGAIREAIIKQKGEDAQESALILVNRITTITIVTIGVTIAFAINGLNFTAIIGALSLGIGFALKDIIGNFISGVIMLSQDRIRIGDFVKVKDILGTIVNIDTRATILQAIDGTEVVIPNQTMLSETLISYSTNPFRRLELVVGVDYNTDLPMVTSLIKGIIDKNKDIVVKPEPLVLVDEFGDSAINIKILFWIESSKDWMSIRSNLANRIKKTFNELSINIPFPIRTLKLDEDDRSFLKTMESLKKGFVPEMATIPTNEAVMSSALGTENEPTVPHQLFKKETRKYPTEGAQPTATPEVKPAEKKEEDQSSAPPSHL